MFGDGVVVTVWLCWSCCTPPPLCPSCSQCCGRQSSGWGTICLQNVVMPLNWKKVGTTIESCSNKSSFIAKSVKNNTHTLANKAKVATAEDKLSSWGTPWSRNSANISSPSNHNFHTFFSSSQSSMHSDQLQQTAREYSWKNTCSQDTDMQKPCPNDCLHMLLQVHFLQILQEKAPPYTLPSDAARKSPPNSFPSDAVRKVTLNSFPSNAARKIHWNNAHHLQNWKTICKLLW